MDWGDSPEQATFRQQVRDFVQSRLPEHYRRKAEGAPDESWSGGWATDRAGAGEAHDAAVDWAHALSEQGWIAPHWPKEFGGGGLSSMEQFIFNAELADLGAPSGVGGSGVSMLGPTIIAHGSDEQKEQYLSEILTGEVSWAQGYSEPGAGSDLGSLQTRAVRDGDEYVVNGQKIWTSGAHNADKIFALVRTDPDAPKHRGISFLLIDDIHTDGLSVRPLVNMSWKHGFNETFFENVRVPVNIVGEENRGWYVGMTLLDFERSNISGAIASRKELDQLIGYLNSDEGQERTQMRPGVRTAITDRYIESEVGFNFSFRIVSMQNAGIIPNYEASTSKLFMSELVQTTARTATKALGLHANVWAEDSKWTPMYAYFTHRYVTTIPNTIGGGTSEIQRNIIATRGLGLPRG
ncbi:MAG: acyl-CoA dehydrogenase family protein [Chloroflexota bacterium]|nr:acyl-CoA dehydrogenase family protein [Chloroflexota bacterium]